MAVCRSNSPLTSFPLVAPNDDLVIALQIAKIGAQYREYGIVVGKHSSKPSL